MSNRKRSSPSRQQAPRHHGPIRSLTIERFRGFKKFSVEGLAPLTVVTGDNGSGKTTFLEAAFALFGRTNPSWLLHLQGRRGLGTFSARGPSYPGLFHWGADQKGARVLGVTVDGNRVRMEVELRESGTTVVRSAEQGRDAGPFPSGDIARLAQLNMFPVFRAYLNDVLENESELVWTIRGPGHAELEVRNGRPPDAAAFLQHPGSLPPGEDERARYNDLREKGQHRFVVEVLKTIDERAEDVEYLETTRAAYFSVKLNGRRSRIKRG